MRIHVRPQAEALSSMRGNAFVREASASFHRQHQPEQTLKEGFIMKNAKSIFGIMLLALLACGRGEDASQKLLGSWSGIDQQDIHHTFIFHADNTMSWVLAEAGTVHVRYRFDPSTTPYQLDLTGFQGPPLEGKSLYGILEFVDDTAIRFDCDAGPVDADGDTLRPTTFTESTVTYTKNK